LSKTVEAAIRLLEMVKKLFVVLIFLGCVIAAFTQSKPRLGILPFTGGADGDGETIATLFSFQGDIQSAFTVVPRTSAVNALVTEQNFQMAGFTDSDTIARIGRLLNADFVVSGHIRRLGDSNLIIATIIDVETFEQMVGDYRQYRTIEEVRGLLPEIAKKMITATYRNSSKLPKLAIAPFNIANKGVNVQDAEVLAQILAVEITNTSKYAVLPRTATMQAALTELNYQMKGYTAEEGAKALGRAINAEYVLSAEVRSLGSMNMFTAQILHVEDGSQLAGDMRDYQVVDDGIKLMAELAILLTDRMGAQAQISARKKESAHEAFWNDPARFWSIGVSAGSSFADPWVIGTIHGTIAPFRYSFLELGCDVGFVSTVVNNIEGSIYYSVCPFVHLAFFIPSTGNGGWYVGTGSGYSIARYNMPEKHIVLNIIAMDFIAGVIIGNVFNISYTLRTNFESASNKIAIGYTCRFK